MINAVSNKKVRIAKLAGSIYFIILGIAILIATGLNKLSYREFIVFALFCMPLIVNKKIFYLLFGGATSIVSIYALYFVFNTNTLYVRGQYDYTNTHFSPAEAFTIGYIFTAISACFSLMLLYVGTRGENKKE